MNYYENHDEERKERIFNLCTYIFIAIVIAILILGAFVIDFKEIDTNIKTEKNERY